MPFTAMTEREMLLFTYGYLNGFESRLRHINDGDVGAVGRAADDLAKVTEMVGRTLTKIEESLSKGDRDE